MGTDVSDLTFKDQIRNFSYTDMNGDSITYELYKLFAAINVRHSKNCFCK